MEQQTKEIMRTYFFFKKEFEEVRKFSRKMTQYYLASQCHVPYGKEPYLFEKELKEIKYLLKELMDKSNNLESIIQSKRKEYGETNHIEIRTIGGTNYQRKVEQILSELEQFIEIFKRAIKSDTVDEEYKNILQKHIVVVKTASKERREKFLQLIS